MRKLSKLLKICTGYHSYWGATNNEIYMCYSASLAQIDDAISEQEMHFVQNACMGLVESINPSSASIEGALLFGLGIEGCKKDLVINIYEAWIDKLESQEK